MPADVTVNVQTVDDRATRAMESELDSGSEETITPPERTRQSLAPQPEAAPKDKLEDIIKNANCPAPIKRLLLTELTALSEMEGIESLNEYLRKSANLSVQILLGQLKVMKRRASRLSTDTGGT